VIFLEIAGSESVGDVVGMLSVYGCGPQDAIEKQKDELEKHGN
jgi:hypothetical protein